MVKALQRAVVVRYSRWAIVEWTYEGGLKCWISAE